MYTVMCILSLWCMRFRSPDLLSVIYVQKDPGSFLSARHSTYYSDNHWWYVHLFLVNQVLNRHSRSRQLLPSRSIHHPCSCHLPPPIHHSYCPLHFHRRKSDFAHWKIACPFSGMEWETVSCVGRDPGPGSARPLTSWSSAWTRPLPLCPLTSESAWWSQTWAPSPPPG